MKVITVAAAVISNAQQQLLLVRKQNTAFFMQVGGKLEKNEDPEQALLREIEEEIGVSATIIQFVGRFETAAANESGHQLISYVYEVEISDPPHIDAEIAEMRWVDPHLSQAAYTALGIQLAPLSAEVIFPWYQQSLASAAHPVLRES